MMAGRKSGSVHRQGSGMITRIWRQCSPIRINGCGYFRRTAAGSAGSDHGRHLQYDLRRQRDMSTNDTCILMANGMSGARPRSASLDSEDGKVFFEAMKAVQAELAQSIVRDGEGGGDDEVNVYGAESKKDARTLARSVVESSLVKTAIFGADANWGRITPVRAGLRGCGFRIVQGGLDPLRPRRSC